MAPKFIIYIHIEKNAGSTMHYILNQNFPFYVTLNCDPKFRNDRPFNEKSFRRFLSITNDKIQGIGGHTVYPIFDYKNQLPDNTAAFMFTFLRDPVKRWLSHLNYRISAMEQNWCLDSFLENEEFSNFQTKKIAGIPNADDAISIIKKSFPFVGIMESFDEGLLLLKKELSDDFNINYQRINELSKARKKYVFDDLTKEQIGKIQKRNMEDMQLYEFIKNEFYPKQLLSYAGDIHHDLTEFRKINTSYKFKRSDKIWLKFKNQVVKYVLQPKAMRFC